MNDTGQVREAGSMPDCDAIPSGADLIDEISAVRLLIALGELVPDRLFDDAVLVTDHSRRSRCLIVRDGHRGWVLKQGTGVDTADAVRFESQMYRLFQESGTSLSVPRFVHADVWRCLLVVECVAGEPLLDGSDGDDETKRVQVASELGKVLAVIHRFGHLTRLPELPPPPILAAFRPGLDSLRYRSSASLELIALLQAKPELCGELEALTRLWRPIVMSHNDVRSDNLLVDRQQGRVHVIDWELAGLGDPHWDLVGPLAEQLSWWLAAAKFWSPEGTAEAADAQSLAPVHEFTIPYLGSYLMRAGTQLIDLCTLMRWCAARLV